MIGPSPAKAWTSKPMPVRGTSRPASHCSARSKSARVVSLSSAGSPSTAATVMPGGAKRRVVSSVGEGARPAVVGLTQRVEAEGLRRLDADQAGPVDRLAERFADARERVADGEHRRGAVEEFEAASSRSTTAGGQKGRAASWTSTASPSIAARPARTESARSRRRR